MSNSLDINKLKYSTKAIETSIILLIDQVAAAIVVTVAHLKDFLSIHKTFPQI